MGPRITTNCRSPETSSLENTLPASAGIFSMAVEQVAEPVRSVTPLIDALHPLEHLGQHVLHLRRGRGGASGARWVPGRPRRGHQLVGRWQDDPRGAHRRLARGHRRRRPVRWPHHRGLEASGRHVHPARPVRVLHLSCDADQRRLRPSVWLIGSTIAGVGGGTTGSGTGVPIGVGRGFTLMQRSPTRTSPGCGTPACCSCR